MSFADWFKGGPDKKDPLYEELFEFEKAKKALGKKSLGKDEARKTADTLYYLSTIFLAFGRTKEFAECIDSLHKINPAPWIVEHKELAEAFSKTKGTEVGIRQPEIFAHYKTIMGPMLKKLGMIQVTGQAAVYIEQKGEDVATAAEPPHEKYGSRCVEPLAKKLLQISHTYGLLLIDNTRVAQYLLDNPIETHRALTQVGMILRRKLAQETEYQNKIFTKMKEFKGKAYQDVNENVNTMNYARGMLDSYYFLLTENFKLFEEALDECMDGCRTLKSKKTGPEFMQKYIGYPKDPEWVEDYKKLATEETANVYKAIVFALEEVMKKADKYVEKGGRIYPSDSATDKDGNVILDEAIGPETPLHRSKEYKPYCKEIKGEAERLYGIFGLKPKEAREYAELLAAYLLDYPMKAYSATNRVSLIVEGKYYELAKGK